MNFHSIVDAYIPLRWRDPVKAVVYRGRDRQLLAHIAREEIRDPILFSGFVKSGNTWFRFLFFNYFNLLRHGAQETLTFDELNRIQRHLLHRDNTTPFDPGFPAFYRSHCQYRAVFRHFRTIYIHRNPLDTLISLYHWWHKRKPPFVQMPIWMRGRMTGNPDAFVRRALPWWIQHHRTTVDRSDFVVSYEQLKADAAGEFRRLFDWLGYDVDEAVLQRSVELSQFDNLKRMAAATGQERAMGLPGQFTGTFLRCGTSNQYQDALSLDTVAEATRVLQCNGIPLQRAA